MEINDHCRLCAKIKSSDGLINLQLDDVKKQEIIYKLVRINAANSDVFNDNVLPRTVCFGCMDGLDKAYEFVLTVERALGVINDIILVKSVKQEANLSEDEDYNFENHSYDAGEVKEEIMQLKIEPEVKIETLSEEKINKSGKPVKRKTQIKHTSLDSLPLSQLKLTWDDYDWQCSYCGTQFSTLEELRNHTIEYHKACNMFRCTDCNIRKLRLNSFLLHVKRHRKYLKLSCYLCHTKFQTAHDTNVHVQAHFGGKVSCPGCNLAFEKPEDLSAHTAIYYKEKRQREIPLVPHPIDNLTCSICNKQFKHKASLLTHVLIHTERKRDHTCDKCGKCFLNKQNLAGHMVLHEDARPYQCQICKFGFKTASQLKNHVGVHDGKKPYACDQCGRCFRLQKHLTSHLIIHTDSLPHVCSYCQKGFRFKTILNQHLRQHTGIKPYCCKICQRDFTNWPNYNKHMKRRHGMDMARKKHTPDGVYPINPTTGEIVIFPENEKTLEWKRLMMAQRRPGRPKISKPEEEESKVAQDMSI